MRTHEEAVKLFHDNIALAYFARNRYGRILDGCRELSGEDIGQICLLGLWTAALRFDPARGLKFSTYAVSAVRGAMRTACRAQARQCAPGAVPLDSVAVDLPDGWEAVGGCNVPDPADLEEEACANVSYDAFVRALPERNRFLLACRNADMSQAEIGRAVGLSQVHVSRVIRKLARQYAAES